MQFSGIPPGYDRLRRAQPIASDELIGYSTADAVQVPSPGGGGATKYGFIDQNS